MKDIDAMKCECADWAGDVRQRMLGNGHHERCEHFRPNEGAAALLARLVEGIKWWGSQEDGVPDELWEPYCQAHFIATGKWPDDAQE